MLMPPSPAPISRTEIARRAACHGRGLAHRQRVTAQAVGDGVLEVAGRKLAHGTQTDDHRTG